jgi:hypothetical protein
LGSINDAENHWKRRLEPAINVKNEGSPSAYEREKVNFSRCQDEDEDEDHIGEDLLADLGSLKIGH